MVEPSDVDEFVLILLCSLNVLIVLVLYSFYGGNIFPRHFLLLFQLNLNDDIRERSKIIKQHEDNLKFIDSQSNQLAESILDLQGMSRNLFWFLFYLFP